MLYIHFFEHISLSIVTVTQGKAFGNCSKVGCEFGANHEGSETDHGDGPGKGGRVLMGPKALHKDQ